MTFLVSGSPRLECVAPVLPLPFMLTCSPIVDDVIGVFSVLDRPASNNYNPRGASAFGSSTDDRYGSTIEPPRPPTVNADTMLPSPPTRFSGVTGVGAAASRSPQHVDDRYEHKTSLPHHGPQDPPSPPSTPSTTSEASSSSSVGRAGSRHAAPRGASSRQLDWNVLSKQGAASTASGSSGSSSGSACSSSDGSRLTEGTVRGRLDFEQNNNGVNGIDAGSHRDDDAVSESDSAYADAADGVDAGADAATGTGAPAAHAGGGSDTATNGRIAKDAGNGLNAATTAGASAAPSDPRGGNTATVRNMTGTARAGSNHLDGGAKGHGAVRSGVGGSEAVVGDGGGGSNGLAGLAWDSADVGGVATGGFGVGSFVRQATSILAGSRGRLARMFTFDTAAAPDGGAAAGGGDGGGGGGSSSVSTDGSGMGEDDQGGAVGGGDGEGARVSEV